jgi:hypothetical protein
MSFADTTPVGGIAPLPVGTKPVTLPISMADVTGLITTMVAMPLPGNKVGQTLRWDGTSWKAVDLQVGLPASDTSPGTTGQMHYNGVGSLYLCVAKDQWIKMTDAGAGAWI